MTIHKNLQIDAEFHALIPPLSTEEREQLEQNMLVDGCIDPIAIWNNCIIDGHNRYEICKQHDIDFGIVNISNIGTREDAKIWICDNQLGRRNLTDFVRVELALVKKTMTEVKAKENQRKRAKKEAVFIEGRPKSDDLQKDTEIRTDQAIADMAGVGRTTVRQVEAIKAKGTPEIIAAAKADEISINKAAAIAKKPKAQQAKALKDAKAPKAPKAKKPKEDSPDLVKELEFADKQIRDLQVLVKSLQSDDKAKELAKLHTKYAQLEGRLQLAVTQKNEAEKQAKYSTGLLAKIRQALKVKANSEILEAIRN